MKISLIFTFEENFPILSAYHTKAEKIYLAANGKGQIVLTYLPLQLIKHSGVLIFQSDKVGEFIYYLEGAPTLPEPCKIFFDESSLDSARIKFIKSNRNLKLAFLAFMLLNFLIFIY